MGIALDATSHGINDSSSPLNITHVCASSAFLLVGIAHNSAVTITGVTYNGVAMSFINNYTGNSQVVEYYSLSNPASGSHTIAISYTGGSWVAGAGISFTGAAGTSALKSGTGTTSPQSITVNTNEQVGFVIGGLSIDGTPPATISYTGGGTQWANDGNSNGDSSFAYTSFSASANVTQSWTTSASVSWAAYGIEVYQAPAPSSGFFFAVDR